MEQKSNGMWLRIIDFIRGTFSKILGMIINVLLYPLVILVVLHILLLIIMASAFLAVQLGNYGIVAQQNIPINTDIDPIYLIKIIGVLLAGIFVVAIFRDNDRIVIMPFETSSNTEKCSGKTISDLLIANLVQIFRIQGAKFDETKIKRNTKLFDKIGKEKLSSRSLSKGNLTGISDFDTVVLGPTSFSLGQLLSTLKQICPGNNSEMVITGSLQKYGNVISIVAIMEQKGTEAWEVRRSIKANNDIEYEDISSMISDLAYKIFFDQSKKEISAKNWSGLKYFTQALDRYQQYKLTGDMKILEKSHNKCIRAASVNPGYKKPIILLYNIAIAYWKKEKFYEAEKLFRQIVIMEPDNINAWEGWGIALRFFLLDEAAIKCYETALDKNPEPALEAEIYCMKAISYRNLNKSRESIRCLDKSLELNKKYGLAYQYLGQAHMLEGRRDNAIIAFENCEKYDKNLTLIHPSLARLYNNKGNKKKYYEHCEKAKKSLKGRTEYNRACYQALCENKKEALKLLKIVCKNKLVAKTWIEEDPDLENIRNHSELGPEFRKCLDEYDNTKKIDPTIRLSKLLSEAAIYRKLDLENKYLFSWEKILENDKKKLIEFLMQNFSIEWIRAADINKNDNGKTISATNDANFLSLTLNNKKTNVDLEIDDGRTYKFIVKTENGELNIYENKYEMFMNIRSLLKDENKEYDRARCYAICTDKKEKALVHLRKAIIKKQMSPEIALYDPDFEFIRDDPRFQMLLEEFIEGQEIHSNIETIQLY